MSKKAWNIIYVILTSVVAALAGIFGGDTVKGVITREPVKQEKGVIPGKPGISPTSNNSVPTQLEFKFKKD